MNMLVSTLQDLKVYIGGNDYEVIVGCEHLIFV